jgi:hypothetical protein
MSKDERLRGLLSWKRWSRTNARLRDILGGNKVEDTKSGLSREAALIHEEECGEELIAEICSKRGQGTTKQFYSLELKSGTTM